MDNDQKKNAFRILVASHGMMIKKFHNLILITEAVVLRLECIQTKLLYLVLRKSNSVSFFIHGTLKFPVHTIEQWCPIQLIIFIG